MNHREYASRWIGMQTPWPSKRWRRADASSEKMLFLDRSRKFSTKRLVNALRAPSCESPDYQNF